MPPAVKRNGSVILYDVKTSSEFSEPARKCLLNICASKWFLESKDCTKLILLNTQNTNNWINLKFGKCLHVVEATNVINYDPKLMIPHIQDVETAEGDWLMGLAVAIEALKSNFFEVKGIIGLQLLFITDFSTPLKAKEKRITFIIENLNKMKVHLCILGPKVKVPQHMTSFEDLRQWGKNVEFETDMEENPSLGIAKQIVANANGIICDLKLGQELFKSYVHSRTLQPWKMPLTIGSTVILTSTTRFLRPATVPRVKTEIVDGYTEPWKWHLAEDLLEVVPYNNVIGGVFKHNRFVPLHEDVEKNFKYSGPRCFKVIGFTDKSNIPEIYMCGNGSCYVESDGSKNFKLLVHVLAKQNKCVIARRVYVANCRPKLVALLPNAEDRVLLLVELPYAESIRVNFEEQDVNEAPELDRSNAAVDGIYDYLQKLDITDTASRDENGSVKVPLSANLQDAVKLNLMTRRCLQKYLGNEINKEETDIEIPTFVDTANYKQFIPSRPVVEKKKRAAS